MNKIESGLAFAPARPLPKMSQLGSGDAPIVPHPAPNARKSGALQPIAGHSIIDILIAQALVEAYLDLDYSRTIETARRLAELAERRGAA